jgi:hypothetical protein
MESYNKYSGYTETELLRELNSAKEWHEAIKREIINITQEIENLEKTANEKIIQLENIEKNYVDLMKELTSRQ